MILNIEKQNAERQLMKYIIAFLFTMNLFAQEACIDCDTGSVHDCSQEKITYMKRNLARSKLIIELAVHENLDETPASIFDGHIEMLNELRSCQEQLGFNKNICSVGFRFEKPKSNRFIIDYNLDFISEKDNQCIYRPFSSLVIDNHNGEQLVQSLNGRWTLNQKIMCQSDVDGNIYNNQRNFVLNDDGVLAIDWFIDSKMITRPELEITDSDIRVSQNIGRKIEMGSGVNLSVEINDTINFNYSNGHNMEINTRGELQSSTFIKHDSYNRACQTNTWRRSGRSKPYFIPNLELKPAASNLRITTVNN